MLIKKGAGSELTLSAPEMGQLSQFLHYVFFASPWRIATSPGANSLKVYTTNNKGRNDRCQHADEQVIKELLHEHYLFFGKLARAGTIRKRLRKKQGPLYAGLFG